MLATKIPESNIGDDKMKILILFLSVILALGLYQLAKSGDDPTVKDVRMALQNKQFGEAVRLVDSALATAKEERDFLLYLKGLALFYDKDFSGAIELCNQVIREYEKSPWYRKAIFLKAQCHIQLKQFQQAEAVYDAEVQRLLSTSRKEEIAGIYFRFAEVLSRKPGKDELDAPPPNYNKAYELYKKSLELEIGRDLRDEAMFRLGRMKQSAGDFGQAINEYYSYLDEFDPDWTGPADSPRRMKKPSSQVSKGKHVYEARYYLSESQLAAGQNYWARINLEDLLKLIPQTDPAFEKLISNARFLVIRTYHIPEPEDDEELRLGVKAAQDFLRDFPTDPRAISVAYEIGQAYSHRGRSMDAIEAYRDFLNKTQDTRPMTQDKYIDETGETYAQLFEKLRMSATYKIGEILFAQKNYTGAIETWSQYVAQFPNGPQWADAQYRITNAEFEIGVSLLAEDRYDEAIKTWDKFLEKYPLDPRSQKIMFIYGQMHYHAAEEGRGEDEYKKAISEWEKLVSKYPNTEESSLALLRIGQTYEEKLGDLEKALESYRKLTWGSWYGEAQNRIRIMTEKKLQLFTERIFRTNEPAKVKLNLRNIEKLTISVYKVDMEAYWRKMHGIAGIENLDIALIAPDETYEYKVPDYQKYKPFEKDVEIPINGAGVCAVHVGEDDLEATTLVIRSDIDVIIKSSRREALIFAEDMLDKKPVPGAKVLISDGTKVISEGETGEDGVFHKKLPELKDSARVTAFIIKNGSVASDLLDMTGLGLSSGMTPRGYIYTDRPAYRPGQMVYIRGIIRDVSEGSYSVSPGSSYQISVLDSQGRLLRSEEMKLSAFGTFYTEMVLDNDAPIGEYRITAQSKNDKEKVFNGNFQVQRYQLEKMKLVIEFPRRVYFRGEQVEATFTASYYYGQPVSHKIIRYSLPDGRSYAEETDEEGKLRVTFDTTPMQLDTYLSFQGSIEGENVRVVDRVFLARLGFAITVNTSADAVISGEPFDVIIRTEGADKKPVGEELTLTVYRQMEQKANPILSQIPWQLAEPVPPGEVKVEEHKVTTDNKTGEGRISLKFEEGGNYILRASGIDRFSQPVSGGNSIFISDNKDAVKLRIFTEQTRLKVGETARVRIHSRLKSSAVLVTFEGEGIIHHRVQQLNEGWNEIEFTVGHEYFPNFHIAIAVIDGQSLRTAGKDFTVERQLMLALKLNEFYSPGEEAEVEITATDQLSKPAESELSLALVDEALFAIYPDILQDIGAFFNEGVYRDAAMRTASSCSFRYQPPTRPVSREMLEETERLEKADEIEKYRIEVLSEVNGAVSLGIQALPALLEAPQQDIKAGVRRYAGGLEEARVASKATGYDAYGYGLEDRATAGEAGGRVIGRGRDIPAVAVREEFAGAGYWLPAVVTDASGKATVKIPMPGNTTQWRLTARGCTVETLVGQAGANTITRKAFFLDIKAPSILTEGDKVRVLARVHNLTDFEGDAELSLKLTIDSKDSVSKKSVKIQKNSTTEAVFDEMPIPAGLEVKIEVTAQAGRMTDGVSRTVPIRPWGMEYADSEGGVVSNDETIFLQLPGDLKYSSKKLTISVGPDVNRLIFDMAMGRFEPVGVAFTSRIPPMPGDAGTDLLAAAYALGYLKTVAVAETTYSVDLLAYTRDLVARLVISQREDGGWSWCGGSAESDIYVSSRTLWALAEARLQGISINTQTLEKATSYLKEAFARVEQNDDDAKSVILHALSSVGEADFAYANRLYRNRNELNPSTLAYTALVFANLDRKEIGGEVLDVLQGKIETEPKPVVPLFKGERARTASDVETTALALLAMESIRPDSPLIKQILERLLSSRTFYGYSPYRAKGPAVAALAVYYGKARFTGSDYRLMISVNGREVKSAQIFREQPAMVIHVPADIIQDGRNKIDFHLEGNARFAYTATLSGFSSEFRDPKTWDRPFIRSRKYYHSPLEYKGRTIASSTSEVTQLQDGERTYVSVDIREGALDRYLIIQEYLPAGTMLVDGSISGEFQHYQTGDGTITFYYPPGRYLRGYQYQLVSYAPGVYRVMPSVIRDAMKAGDMRIGESAALGVLAPGEKSRDEYKMNDAELYELGKAYFDDGQYTDALPLLSQLYVRNQIYNQREVARMLLWIHTEDKYYDSRKVVEYFEILRERFPELYIPFDRILVVGRAYRDIEEFERAYLVYKATIDASFVNDSNVSAVLEDEGQFLSSIDFQESLWKEYPDSPQVISSYFALSQNIYSKVPQVQELVKAGRQIPLLKDQAEPEPKKITKLDLLKETVIMLAEFLTLYPDDPLADDASFSLANALLDLEDFPVVVSLAQAAQRRYPESEYLTSFQYVEALGFFSQHKYNEAVEAARVVADGKSEDRDLARYILGQIYHAQSKPESAMEWYEKVRDIYPDAGESISYFQQKRVSLDEVKVIRPGEKAQITIKYRNIKEASLQVYKVDLMKLYLREKDLSRIRSVQLAGIEPEFSQTIPLGDGKDYVDKERSVDLNLKEEGAYLVICRGDDLFSSGLVLLTPLDVEVQEDAVSGRVRVNVKDAVQGTYCEGVHVKVVGSAEKVFKSGETDLRGLFIADDVRGVATVIARDDKDRYAFYRGAQWLGAREEAKKLEAEPAAAAKWFRADYRANIDMMNQVIQSQNVQEFDQMRRGRQKGVQVQEAY